MNSMTGSVLIDFQKMAGSEEEKDYHKQVYGAIKLQLSEMEQFEKTSAFTSCSKCGMVLTKEDRDSVYDWEEVQSNQGEFAEVMERCSSLQEGAVVWICKFCENRNVVECGAVRFAGKNSRVVLKAGGGSQQKKDPILLIVFDISGSMEEVLPNEQHAYTGLTEKIKKTKIYQKIVADEEREIKEILEKQNIKVEGNDPKLKYRDFLKKNKLLMGLTEWLIAEINPAAGTGSEKMARQGGFSGGAVKKTKLSKTVGFVFFNSNVILEPTSANGGKHAVVICDLKEGYGSRTEGMIRERVNFDDFESLYKLGSTYGPEFATKLSEVNFESLEYRFGDCTHGQTALGPAIVLALGVVSQHGAGSSIVVVTDGMGNKGIFDESEKWEEQFRTMKERLERQKCFLSMLECRNVGESLLNREGKRTCLDEFCSRNENSCAQKINMLVDKSKTASQLAEDVKRKMVASINRDNVIWTNQVLIRCQNPNVTFEEDMGRLSQKLHNQQAATYINPKVNYARLAPRDYVHHFMTQAVIRYENTQTGEQSLFMTYLLQKFIRYDAIKKQTVRRLDNERTFMDMMEYLSAEEDNYSISNIPLSFVKKTFRDTLMFSKSICNRSMRFPTHSHPHAPQNDSFMEEIFRKTEAPSPKEQPAEEEQQDTVAL